MIGSELHLLREYGGGTDESVAHTYLLLLSRLDIEDWD